MDKTIMVANQHGQTEIMLVQEIPRIGEQIDLWYHPLPTVKNVIWYPKPETLKQVTNNPQFVMKITAIILAN